MLVPRYFHVLTYLGKYRYTYEAIRSLALSRVHDPLAADMYELGSEASMQVARNGLGAADISVLSNSVRGATCRGLQGVQI